MAEVIEPIFKFTGVDTLTHRAALQRNYCSDAVNRTFRGGKNANRPRFVVTKETYDSQSTEDTLKHGNVTGVFGYNKKSPTRQPHLIVAVADRICAGRISGDYIHWKTIFRGIQPVWLNSYFEQAENILIFSNGKDLPLYWDGLSANMWYAKDAPGVEKPMPVGNFMKYAHGRLFVCTEENLVFVSNHINSNIGVGHTAVLNFNESTYGSDGDGFGVPSTLGQITGISVLHQGNTLDGHGPVVVMCSNGCFTIDPRKPRDQWLSDPSIQQIAMTGRGAASPHILNVNGDIWYRCPDRSIATFNHSRYIVLEKWNNTSISGEISRYLEFDTADTAAFSHSVFHDNRVIFSTCHRFKPQTREEWGYHRYALGLVACDLAEGTGTHKDEPLTWEGLWTGIRSCGVASIYEGHEHRALFVSYDEDGVNRTYELTNKSGNDIGPNGEVQTRGFYVVEGVGFNPQQMALAYFSSSILCLEDARSGTSITQSIRPDSDTCWYPTSPSTEILDGGNCDGITPPLSGSITFTSLQNRTNRAHSSNVGRRFSLKTEIVGSAQIFDNIIFLKLSPLNNSFPDRLGQCTPVSFLCCPDSYFNYRIVWQ